jgi:hypothetical protein
MLGNLFKIDSGSISAVLTARVAVAVGVPLLGFLLAGRPLAAVVAAATAMFVTLSDVGNSAKERGGTMLAATLAMLGGGFIGARFGGTAYADEVVVLVSALVAGWVSGSHPGIATVARFAALATAAGMGLRGSEHGFTAVAALLAGGIWALAAAVTAWKLSGMPAEVNHMDWRAGVRRALASADAGPRFALCYAGAAALALLFADELGVTNAYWATLTTIMVMRREGMASLTLVIHYMAGTLIGIPIAYALSHAIEQPVAVALLATAAAAGSRVGLAVNPAIGFAAFTVFFLLIIDLALSHSGAPPHLLSVRLYDVTVGCVLALIGTVAASLGTRRTPGGLGTRPPPAD